MAELVRLWPWKQKVSGSNPMGAPKGVCKMRQAGGHSPGRGGALDTFFFCATKGVGHWAQAWTRLGVAVVSAWAGLPKNPVVNQGGVFTQLAESVVNQW